MIAGISFAFWRVMEIITLIPTLGMLAWFVHQYDSANALTPRSILILFIVSVLAAAWAIATLFSYSRARNSAHFVALVDLLFVGAFIGSVYALRGIAHADCSHWDTSGSYNANLGLVTVSGNTWSLDVNKSCAMLKAAFAFGIMNCIFFFITFLLALMLHRHYTGGEYYDSRRRGGNRTVVKRETHYSRRGHRSRSPRHSHHSHHSSRRHYV